MRILLFSLCTFIGVVGVWAAPRSTHDDLQEDIDWALTNTTKLASDISNLHNCEIMYYHYLFVVIGGDFAHIEKLLYDVGVDSFEVVRLTELLNAMSSEIRLMIEQHLTDCDAVQFQCIKILSSLRLDLLRLHGERITIDEMMSDMMQDLSITKLVVNSLFANVKSTILDLIQNMSGPEVDEIIATLDKIQQNLGIKSSEVQAKANVASSTNSELKTILDWIIAQTAASIIT